MKLYTKKDFLKAAEFCEVSMIDAKYIIERVDEVTDPIELPSDTEIWRWWQTQKFQKEQGEQEYTMLYEIDLPKILKSFTEHLIQGGNK